MNNDIYNLINAEYSQKRISSEILREKRQKEIFDKFPDFVALNNEIEHLAFENIHLLINLKDKSEKEAVTQRLQDKINELSARKKNILELAGYPTDYLEDVYECSICKDRGMVENDGKVTTCSCYVQRLIDLSQSTSGIGSNEMYSFDNFDLSLFEDCPNEEKYDCCVSPRENIAKIKESVVNYCDNAFSKPGEKNLLFTGQIGAGKTFLSKCLGRYLINKGYSVFYVSAPEMFDIINNSKFNVEASDDGLIRDKVFLIREADCLIIDDLGTETISEAKMSALLSLINYRLEKDKLGKKPYKIIISTNIPAEKLGKMYEDRIVSRIWGNSYMYRFVGNDLRLS